MSNSEKALAREILARDLMFLAITTAVLGGLATLMFYISGVLSYVGWALLVSLAIVTVRGLWQVYRLWRGRIRVR